MLLYLKEKLTAHLPIVWNIIWLFGDHLVKLLGGLFIGIWLARYLGPDRFGVYSFALATFAIASSFSQLGLSGLSVRELVRSSDINSSIGTISGLKIIGSVVSFLSVLLFLFFEGVSGDKYWMTLIICSATLLTPFTTIDNYFDSKVESKFRVIPRRAGFILRSCLIIAFILFEWPLLYLAFIALFEHVVSVVGLSVFFLRQGVKGKKFFNSDKARTLLGQSWPLIISSLGAILYLKMDQIMVVTMIGDAEGGQYGAAVRFTSLFYVIHSVVLTSFFPKLVAIRKKSKGKYYNQIRNLIAFFMYSSVAVIIGTFIFGSDFVKLTFGISYLPAVDIIEIHILCLPLVYIGAILSKWLILEDLTRLSLVRHSLGFGVNLILNLVLIPSLGASGAALASLISLIASCIIVLFIHERLRELGLLILQSVYWPILNSLGRR